MRLKAELTVEASYIFPFVIILIGVMIKFTLTLHDGVLNDSVKIRQGIRAKEMELFYYDISKEKIDKYAIVASPLSGKENFYKNNEQTLVNKITNYYNQNKLLGNTSITNTESEEVIRRDDNANIIRAGNKLMQY